MNADEVKEANAILQTVLRALLDMVNGSANANSKSVVAAKTAIGLLMSTGASQIAAGSLGSQLASCFAQVQQLGATRVQMDGIRVAMLNYTPVPVSIPAVAVAAFSIYFALIQEANILSATSFTSREDVDAMLTTMNAAFDPIEEFLADVMNDPSVYQALLSLHSAVTNYLVTTARPLPMMANYSFNIRMPSLVLSQRIYGDATHADDLLDENKTVHPAFMQSAGRYLAQ